VAIKYREIVLEALPEELEAALQLGYDWISKGSLEQAREVFAGVTRQALEGEEAEQVCRGLNTIGDVLMELEDDRGALIAYRAGLEIRNALAQRDPDETVWQRDLSVSHDKIGDALVRQAKTRKARAAYRAGLEITETLARQDHENVQWQEGIAAFCLKLGSLDCLMTVKTRRQYVSRARDILFSLKTQGRFSDDEELINQPDAALKHSSLFNWKTARTAQKVIGTGLLAAHIFHHSFIVEPGRVAIYFVIFCSVSIISLN
jgi:tetratricopeptide (TPR) repeat protein